MPSLSSLLRPMLLLLGGSAISRGVLTSVVMWRVILVVPVSLWLMRWTSLFSLRLLRLLPLRRLRRRGWRPLLDLLARRRLSNGRRRRWGLWHILRLRRSYRRYRLRRDLEIEVVLDTHELRKRIVPALKVINLLFKARGAKRRFLHRLGERNLTRCRSRSLCRGVVGVEFVQKRIEIIVIIIVRGRHWILSWWRRRRHH
jgi:hypothetical protein